MAAADPPGGAGPRAGAGPRDDAGSMEGSSVEDCCGSSNPVAAAFYSPEKAAAVAVADVWKANPTQSSRWTSAFGGGLE